MNGWNQSRRLPYGKNRTRSLNSGEMGMAAVKKTDIPEIACFMQDYWEFKKSVWVVEEGDGYWQDAIARASELGKKYQQDLCQAEVNVFMDYLEWTDEKKHGKTELGFNRWLYMRYARRAELDRKGQTDE